MILRTWKAKTTSKNINAYFERVRTVALPHLNKKTGYRGSQFYIRHIGSDYLEILVLTFWDSHDAVNDFSGSGENTKAWLPPEIPEKLESWDDYAKHFELKLSDPCL